jgi:hypothetical protein
MLTRGRSVSPSFTTGDLGNSSRLATRLYPCLPDAPVLLSTVSKLNVLKCMIVVVTWMYMCGMGVMRMNVIPANLDLDSYGVTAQEPGT